MKNYQASWNCADEASPETQSVNAEELDSEAPSPTPIPSNPDSSDAKFYELIEESHQRIETLWTYMAEAFSIITSATEESSKRLDSLEKQLETLRIELENLSQSAQRSEDSVSEKVSDLSEYVRNLLIELRNEQRQEFRHLSDRVFDVFASRFQPNSKGNAGSPAANKTQDAAPSKEAAPRRALTAEIRPAPAPQMLIPREEMERYYQNTEEKNSATTIRKRFVGRFGK